MNANLDKYGISAAGAGSAVFAALGSVCLALAATGCSRRVAAVEEEKQERRNPSLVQAKQLQENGNYEEAIRSYKAIVRRDPENALAHFELGLLLQDNQGDDAGAVYHFETYLDLSPRADKSEVAKERIEQARVSLGRKYGRSGGSDKISDISSAQIAARIEELNARISEKDRTIQNLRTQMQDLSEENSRLGKDVTKLNRRLGFLLNQDITQATAYTDKPSYGMQTVRDFARQEPTLPAASAARKAASPGAHTWEVKRGDTLWSVAQAVYGDPARNKDIREANPGVIGPNDQLVEGTILVVPFP